MSQTEIRIAGFGGQGVVLCGMVIGRAACIYDGRYATLTQSFGPEARGGACAVQVILSEQPVLYPYVTEPNILTVMSQEAAAKFVPGIKPGTTVICEADLVKVDDLSAGGRVCRIPSTRLAEELGAKLVQNIVMAGFITGVTGAVTPEAVRKSVSDLVPQGTEYMNLQALEKGLDYARHVLSAAG